MADAQGVESVESIMVEPEREEASSLDFVEEECHVIHEADDPDLDENFTRELYDNELENAFTMKFAMIVIEPKKLGDQVSKWIQVGNFIHKSSVICSFGCLISPLLLPGSNRTVVSLSLGGTSLLLAAVYNISWQFDPCCKYQVEFDSHNLIKIPLESLTTPSPVVLVYKDDKYRKRLHNIASVAVCIYMGYKAYQMWLSSS